MKWPLLPRRSNKTEEEYIDGLRRKIASLDRWKPVMILVVGVAMILLLAVLIRVFWDPPLLRPGNLTITRIWFAVAISTGFMLGLGFTMAIQRLMFSSSWIRNERLLLKYYDAHKSEIPGNDEPRDTRPPF